MAKQFDPHHRWLGIPPAEQPPHHYRLLAIAPFEANPDVIEAAADQRMAHLRNYQSGEHSALSQDLLNEVAKAKVCLLNPEKKAEYDRQLRKRLEPKRKVIPKAVPLEPEPPIDSGLVKLAETTGSGADVARTQAARNRRQTQVAAGVAITVVGLIAAAAVVLWAFRPTGETMLVLDWPAAQRRQARLEIDGRQTDLEPAGALEYRLGPGHHRVRALRPDYRPYEKEFTLVEGKRVTIEPQWYKMPAKPEKPSTGAAPKPPGPKAQPKPPKDDPGEVVAIPKPTPKPTPKLTPKEEPEKPKRLPLPAAEEQELARRQLNEVYDLSKNRAPSEKRALAAELLGLADRSAKPADRFVLLRTALELQCSGGDAAGMLTTAERIAAVFDTEALSVKRHFLEQFAEGAKDSVRIGALVAATDLMIDAALQEDQYDLAQELADLAYRTTQHTTGRQLRKRAFDRRSEVQALVAEWKRLQTLLDKLKEAPDDPEANLAAGRYWCFQRGDWDRGLAHLAKSSDAGLKKLAVQEVESSPPDVAAMLALADAWWDLAQSRGGKEKEPLMLRAGTWYREAQPDVASALVKVKVDKRLAEIAKLGRPIPAPAVQGPPPPAVAPFDAAQAKRYQQRWASHLGVPVETTNSIGMKLVLIPPGVFQMGSSKEEAERLLAEAKERSLPDWYVALLPVETPQHRVTISRPFCLGSAEVTVGQFRQFVGATGYETEVEKDGEGVSAKDGVTGELTSKPENVWRNPRFAASDQHPVVQVTWNDAKAFCEWLSGREKGTYRLPTEAEWEYACRAGTTTRWFFGDDEAGLQSYAWFSGNSGLTTHPVAQKGANPWGLYDVYGNVSEWCRDRADRKYYDHSPPVDPTGLPVGTHRTLRGYACNYGAWACRSGLRDPARPNLANFRLGFRIVCQFPDRSSGNTSTNPQPSTTRQDDPTAPDAKAYLSPKEVLDLLTIPDGRIEGDTITWEDKGGWVMSRRPITALPVHFGFDIKVPHNHIIRFQMDGHGYGLVRGPGGKPQTDVYTNLEPRPPKKKIDDVGINPPDAWHSMSLRAEDGKLRVFCDGRQVHEVSLPKEPAEGSKIHVGLGDHKTLVSIRRVYLVAR